MLKYILNPVWLFKKYALAKSSPREALRCSQRGRGIATGIDPDAIDMMEEGTP
jgi:hypothetical protein